MSRVKAAIPPVRDRSTAKARKDALTRLRERFEMENEGEEFNADREPIITPMLKEAEGGIDRIMEALRAHDDEDARDFIDLYDDLSVTDRKYLTLEEISVAAGIGSLRLAEIAQSAMILHGQLTTKLLLASHMSKIVRASIKQAVTPKGLADREMMLKAGGVLPVPKGATIAIQNNLTEGKGETKEITAPAPEYLDPGQRLRLIHDAVESRRLPSPPSEPVSIGGKIDNIQTHVAEIIEGRF